MCPSHTTLMTLVDQKVFLDIERWPKQTKNVWKQPQRTSTSMTSTWDLKTSIKWPSHCEAQHTSIDQEEYRKPLVDLDVNETILCYFKLRQSLVHKPTWLRVMQKQQFLLLGLNSSDLWRISWNCCTVSPQHFQYLAIQFELVQFWFEARSFPWSMNSGVFVSTDIGTQCFKKDQVEVHLKKPKLSWLLDIFTSIRIHLESRMESPQLNDALQNRAQSPIKRQQDDEKRALSPIKGRCCFLLHT